MYYEEKLINGVLMFRNRPDGSWQQCSIEKMSERILEQKEIIFNLKAELSEKIGSLNESN